MCVVDKCIVGCNCMYISVCKFINVYLSMCICVSVCVLMCIGVYYVVILMLAATRNIGVIGEK